MSYRELGRRALLLNVAFWTLFGLLQATNWLLGPVSIRYPYPGRLFANSMVNAAMWALLTPAIFRLATRMYPGRGVGIAGIAGTVLLGLGLAAVAALGAAVAHSLMLPPPPGARPPAGIGWFWVVGHWYFPAVVTFFVVLVAGLASETSRRFRAREREAAELQAQASRLEAERAELRADAARLQAQSAALTAQLAEARLAMLRARLNPHFLFNTLNAVSALVAKDPRGVRNMIALLSELLRFALTDSKEQEIPLREELRLLGLYLEILEIRYQGQLKSSVAAGREVQDALVPNLILQPLVENAMKHGIDPAGGHGVIEVRAHRSGEELVLTVRDTGAPGGAQPPKGEGGVGLRLTRDRLAELYGDEQRLSLGPVSGGGMLARITLPYHTSDDVRLAEEVTDA